MVELLTNLLSPIFGPMGVSAADLSDYIGQVEGYVWGIFWVTIAMIVAMILATLAKKGVKHVIRWTSVVCWALIVTIVANVICYGPLKSNISMVLNGGGNAFVLSEETIASSKAVIKEVGEEGIVMVKNDGLLPLSGDVKNLNVFGWDSTNPLFGGTGSGSSDGASSVGILASLAQAGYTTNADLTKIYTDYRVDRPTIAMANQDWTLPEPTVDVYTDAVMSQAKGFSDVAVIVIGRSGGEGADLPTDMYAVTHGTWNLASQMATGSYGYTNGVYTNNGSYDDFEPGQSYLELNKTEKDMIGKVCSEFDKVVVIINANNTMELGWVDEYPQIGAVLLAPGGGNTGFIALGEIMNGSVNPSGKTVDTFVKDLSATPTANNSGNFSFTNVEALRQALTADSAYEGNVAFVNYVEGIYVGYKFYETMYTELQAAGQDADAWYNERVQYPFGYGMSYTTFTQEIVSLDASGDDVKVSVKVTNTGSVAGKDVVQLYLTAPYTNGGIEKASASLIDYAKTSKLEPGKDETISFTIAKEDMASYDDKGNGRYVLEAGEYTISARADSHNVLSAQSFTVDAEIDYSNGRPSDLTAATNQFTDYARGSFEQLSRKDCFANYESATAAPSAEARVMDDATLAEVESHTTVKYNGTLYDDPADVMPAMGVKTGLQVAKLRGVAYDDAQWEQLIQQMTFDEMATLINMGGWMTQAIDSIGLVNTNNCDGPAGLNNFITGAQGTAYPAEVLMAQTWNPDLIERMAEAMGQEYADVNNFGVYGPAMNIHRDAFAGRNFEYFSEDGVLSAKMAAAVVKGQQSKGCYSYIKHFALNDQETNRCSLLLTYASEQAIREIYLKPFEAAVKDADAHAAMSSFNWIGTVPCCVNGNLLNNVLRNEWGFKGLVCTDYDGSYGYMVVDSMVRNGGNLCLGFGNAANPAHPNALPNAGGEPSATLVKGMQLACKNIAYTIANSGYYANAVETGGLNAMDKLFLTIDVCVGVALLLIMAIVLINFFKKNSKKAKKAKK